jgi:hypothetical protein
MLGYRCPGARRSGARVKSILSLLIAAAAANKREKHLCYRGEHISRAFLLQQSEEKSEGVVAN